MSHDNPDAIDRTVEKTHIWLRDIARDLGDDNRRRAYHALRAVLHALRDRLSVDDAAAVGAQLPLLIRGIYYEGWHPHGKPLRARKPDEFLALVSDNLLSDGEDELDPREALRAVVAELSRELDAGLVDKLFIVLPPALHPLMYAAS